MIRCLYLKPHFFVSTTKPNQIPNSFTYFLIHLQTPSTKVLRIQAMYVSNGGNMSVSAGDSLVIRIPGKSTQPAAAVPMPSTSDCCCGKLPPPSPHVTACQSPSRPVRARRHTDRDGRDANGWMNERGGRDGWKRTKGSSTFIHPLPQKGPWEWQGYGAVRVPSTRGGARRNHPDVDIALGFFHSSPRARGALERVSFFCVGAATFYKTTLNMIVSVWLYLVLFTTLSSCSTLIFNSLINSVRQGSGDF
jgi:hypothetical protein